MGYYTSIVIFIKNKSYTTCNRDGFEEYVEEELEKLINYYLIYRDYVKNWLEFLNSKMNYMKKRHLEYIWHDGKHDTHSDQYHYLTFYSDEIVHNEIFPNPNPKFNMKIKVEDIKERKANSEEFQEFLNKRFLLDKIWEKYKVAPCLAKWIQCSYF